MALDVDRFDLSLLSGRAPDDRRGLLFRETAAERLERCALGLLWPLRPDRLAGLPALARLVLMDLIAPDQALPDPEATLNAAGLCGLVHDLSAATLVAAYERGLFTFAHVGPLKWVSPPERCVLFFNEIHLARKLRRQMRQGRYTVTFDRDFEAIIKACAGRRDGKWHVTWITPRIMRAYAELFDAGYAHSFEVWNEAGALAGGGYGVAVGGAFFTESQFSREPNTSKIGFSALNWHLARWGYRFNDGKWPTRTTLDMGFRSITRRRFLGELAKATQQGGKDGRWSPEADLRTIAAWPEADAAWSEAHPTRREPVTREAMGF